LWRNGGVHSFEGHLVRSDTTPVRSNAKHKRYLKADVSTSPNDGQFKKGAKVEHMTTVNYTCLSWRG
jgi:hypothetical protein